jgi:hypothetical protein
VWTHPYLLAPKNGSYTQDFHGHMVTKVDSISGGGKPASLYQVDPQVLGGGQDAQCYYPTEKPVLTLVSAGADVCVPRTQIVHKGKVIHSS